MQVVFLLKGNEKSILKVFDKIEGIDILLVTDGYQDKGLIMINFFDSGKGTLQFEINLANILNQNLRIMQDKILLGGTEIDVATSIAMAEVSPFKNKNKICKEFDRLKLPGRQKHCPEQGNSDGKKFNTQRLNSGTTKILTTRQPSSNKAKMNWLVRFENSGTAKNICHSKSGP